MRWSIQNSKNWAPKEFYWVWHAHDPYLVYAARDKNGAFCVLCKERCPKSIIFQFDLYPKEKQGNLSNHTKLLFADNQLKDYINMILIDQKGKSIPPRFLSGQEITLDKEIIRKIIEKDYVE